MNPRRLRAYFFLIAASAIWGVAAIVIKFTLQGFDPIPFLTYRFFIASLVGLFSVGPILRVARKSMKQFMGIIIYSILSTTFALGFLFLGLDTSSVLNLAVLSLIAPILAEYVGVIFLKEHLTSKEKIGTAIAFLGAIFVIIEPALESGTDAGTFTGNLFLGLYLLADLASIVFLKRLLRVKVEPFHLANISFLIGFLALLPIALYLYGSSIIINAVATTPIQYHLGVLYMALISGTLAYFLRNKGQKSVEMGEASLFAYTTSIFSVPLAVIFLGESITIPFIIGATIVIIGVTIAEFKSK